MKSNDEPEFQTYSVCKKRDVAQYRGDAQRNHLVHIEGKDDQNRCEIADGITPMHRTSLSTAVHPDDR